MIRLAKHRISDADWQRARAVLDSGNLVYGAVGQEVEGQLARYMGAERCLVVSSGTAALHLSLLALDIGPGDAVICPAFTFPATANVIEAVGARVVFCDVEPRSYCASPRTISAAIAAFKGPERLKAIMLVDEFGYPADAKGVREIAGEDELFLVEDAACAIGCREAGGAHIGAHAHFTCYSFHPRKTVTCGEGGAVAGPRSDRMDRVAALRNHGMVASQGRVEFVAAGLNYRLTDIQSALLPSQVEGLDAELDRRRALAARYAEHLGRLNTITLPEVPAGHSLQTFMPVLAGGIDRSRVIEGLKRRGIESNYGAPCVPLVAHYRERHPHARAEFPVSDRLAAQGLALPLYGALSVENIDFICQALIEVLSEESNQRDGKAHEQSSQLG